jgi:hypothetical protein
MMKEMGEVAKWQMLKKEKIGMLMETRTYVAPDEAQ